MGPVVLYHGGCFDGFCAAWVARKAIGNIEAIPVQYGQEPPEVANDKDRKLFIVDFSYPRDIMFRLAALRHEEMICLDHHKTAQAALDGLEIELASNNCGDALTIRFDVGKSGGRLAWEYFFPWKPSPWLVDYTEDRDLWRWKLPFSREVNAALRSYPFDFGLWDAWFNASVIVPSDLISEGGAILRREQQIIDQHVSFAREIDLDGHKILAVNSTVLFSEIAGELAKGRPFGAAWFIRQDGKRVWSLRSRDGGIDVSEVAKRHGGGGHFAAAGFEEEVGGLVP
jgi:uncharacterized protein